MNTRVMILVVSLGAALAAGVPACTSEGGSAASGGATTLEAQAYDLAAKGALILDVRTPREYEGGHIEGSMNISHDQIKSRLAELGPDKDRAIILYCRSGRRTGIAAGILAEAGFTNVFDAKRYDRMKAEWERRKR